METAAANTAFYVRGSFLGDVRIELDDRSVNVLIDVGELRSRLMPMYDGKHRFEGKYA